MRSSHKIPRMRPSRGGSTSIYSVLERSMNEVEGFSDEDESVLDMLQLNVIYEENKVTWLDRLFAGAFILFCLPFSIGGMSTLWNEPGLQIFALPFVFVLVSVVLFLVAVFLNKKNLTIPLLLTQVCVMLATVVVFVYFLGSMAMDVVHTFRSQEIYLLGIYFPSGHYGKALLMYLLCLSILVLLFLFLRASLHSTLLIYQSIRAPDRLPIPDSPTIVRLVHFLSGKPKRKDFRYPSDDEPIFPL